MREDRKKRLEAKGWKVGSTKDFLGLTDEEQAILDIRLGLAHGLRERRLGRGMTQAELAHAVESSQSRIAKMEAGDPTVSIDLLVRTLLALGTSKREVGAIISGPRGSRRSSATSKGRPGQAAAAPQRRAQRRVG